MHERQDVGTLRWSKCRTQRCRRAAYERIVMAVEEVRSVRRRPGDARLAAALQRGVAAQSQSPTEPRSQLACLAHPQTSRSSSSSCRTLPAVETVPALFTTTSFTSCYLRESKQNIILVQPPRRRSNVHLTICHRPPKGLRFVTQPIIAHRAHVWVWARLGRGSWQQSPAPRAWTLQPLSTPCSSLFHLLTTSSAAFN